MTIALLSRASLQAQIARLFAAGEQGAWYDPSDMTTLFQDAAGTTPVTAMEQPVGLMLDKRKGLVLGPELISNGDFSNGTTGWGSSGGTLSVDAGRLLVTNNGTLYGYAYQEIATKPGARYRITVDITVGTAGFAFMNIGTSQGSVNVAQFNTNVSKQLVATFVATGTVTYINPLNQNINNGTNYFDNISVRELPGNHAAQPTAASRPVLSARVNLLTATETLATQSVTTLATTYKLSFTGSGSITLSGTAIGTYSAGMYTVTCTAGTLTATVTGSVTKADLRVANDGVGIPPYQRVNTATDYDTAGFPFYLRCDGVDDGMSTVAINFTGRDKITFVLGVRKLSDASAGTLIEISDNWALNPGAAAIFAPGSLVLDGFGIRSNGSNTSQSDIIQNASPTTRVITLNAEISTDTLVGRVNGTQVVSGATDQGTGNYGNYPLYLFRRAGTSFPFSGRFYGAIVRGERINAAQIAAAERWINTRTRAY